MKKILVALLCLVAIAAEAQTYTSASVTVNGKKRTMNVYIPKDMPENAPVMVALHGIGGWGDNLYQGTHYHLVADTAKFAVVYPDAVDGMWDIWNNSDVEFFKKIIGYMAGKYKTDTGRSYLTGFSFGAMMTYHCIHKSAGLFAAYAPVAGIPINYRQPSGSRHVPIIHHHGNKDTTVKFGGDPNHSAGGYPAITDYVTDWARWCGCDMENPVVKKVGNDTHTTWRNEAEDIEVQYNVLHGVGHTISDNPNGTYTTREIWNFVKRYTTINNIQPYEEPNFEERTTTAGVFGTVALDYEASIDGATLYEVVSFDASKGIVITEVDGNTLTAGTPYLYLPSGDKVVFTRLNDASVAHGDYDCTLASVGNGLVGCYSEVGPSKNWFTWIYGNYVIHENRLRLIGDLQLPIPANHCFFDQNKCKAKSVSTPTEEILTPEAFATGISSIEKASKGDGKIYDLSGREVKMMQRGGTYIMDGVKIRVKK